MPRIKPNILCNADESAAFAPAITVDTTAMIGCKTDENAEAIEPSIVPTVL